MAAAFHPLEVTTVDQLCRDAVAITFAVPEEEVERFRFRAGQSLTLRRTVDGQEARRSYSICSLPGAAPRIGVREVQGGAVSRWLVHDVTVGDRIEVQPPTGRFTPDLTVPGHHVLIAAGSGITPVLSITAAVLAAHDSSRVSLICANRRSDTVMFVDDLADLKDRYPSRLLLCHVLSREAQEVDLFSGRLDAHRLPAVLALAGSPQAVDDWWLCGPFDMVSSAAVALRKIGVSDSRVHRELFYVEDVPHERPAAADIPVAGATVSVLLDGRVSTTTVPAGTPILDGVQPARPDLPFACKGGVCGTCRARVTAGEVRMLRNYALEPAELAAGFVLTCQSLCVTEAVTVDYDA